MQLNRISSAALVSLIVHLSVATSYAKPVSMYIKMESTGVNYVYVNFYNDMFQRLYDCITNLYTTQCTAHIQFHKKGSPYPELNNYNVTTITPKRTLYMAQGHFTCQNDQYTTSLQCTRSTGQHEENMCTSFRLSNVSTYECGYLIWKYPNEALVFNNKTDGIEYCKQDCAKTTTVDSTEPSSYPSVTSLPSEQSSDATTNATNIASIGRNESSNTVPVIIGVVLGVLFIAVIVIVVGFIYRRTKRQASNNGVNFPRRNTRYNNEDLARTQASNIPDVLSTLPYSGHGNETNRESEDGYYTIDKDYGLNRYKNGLSTVSSKAFQRPAEGVLNSRGLNKYTNEFRVSPHISHIYEDDAGNSEVSHSLEGNYFTIETQKDDGDKHNTIESVLNSRHLNKYTNELRVPPQTSHADEGDVIPKLSDALEGDYFTIDTGNDGENNKPIESVLRSRHLNKYTNELSFPPQISHVYEGETVPSEPPHAPEGDYFSLETENDFDEDETTVDDEQTIDGGYSLAKDVDIIDEAAVVDVIDVSPPPKNIYSKFADNNNMETKNPYDVLLEKHQILNSRKTSVD